MTIPETLILTEKVGWTDTALGKKIHDSGVKVDYPYCTSIACVLYEAEKDKNNKWRPYYDIFPKDGSCFPYFYTGEEREILKTLSMNGNL